MGGYKNKADLYKNQIARWIKRKKKAIEFLGGKCIRCGYSRYYGALEFHHKDPTLKDFGWSKLRLQTWARIEEELIKCELLCATCHREAHAKEAIYYPTEL